uniref:Expansin n=1 Tax=Ananas comosus var. bracteatus TaxID=296719 RepID=A0A6V7QND5_ANACO|nr:unnamed protein product [Ananas comosus var. bracteatus]
MMCASWSDLNHVLQVVVMWSALIIGPCAAHQRPSSYATSALTEWRSARASYFAADPQDSVGGACGYGDLGRRGYGMATAGLSEGLFARGAACGGCYEVRCVQELRYCLPGPPSSSPPPTSAPPITASPPTPAASATPQPPLLDPHPGLREDRPLEGRRHARPVPPCVREGGVGFTIDGRGFFITVLISNVAGAGDVTAVKIKGSNIGWLSMGRIWGQNWHISADLKGQALSFELTTSDSVTLTSFNVAPKDWSFGQTYAGKQFSF